MAIPSPTRDVPINVLPATNITPISVLDSCNLVTTNSRADNLDNNISRGDVFIPHNSILSSDAVTDNYTLGKESVNAQELNNGKPSGNNNLVSAPSFEDKVSYFPSEANFNKFKALADVGSCQFNSDVDPNSNGDELWEGEEGEFNSLDGSHYFSYEEDNNHRVFDKANLSLDSRIKKKPTKQKKKKAFKKSPMGRVTRSHKSKSQTLSL